MMLLTTRRAARPLTSSLCRTIRSNSSRHVRVLSSNSRLSPRLSTLSSRASSLEACRFAPSTRATSYRYFSTLPTDNDDENESSINHDPVKIMYGSQGGTAQLFSMQLSDALYEADESRQVDIVSLHESPSPDQALDPDSLNIIFISTAGVGEPPDNARQFYEWLSQQQDATTQDWSLIRYAVFGLGNKQAHPNHYNVIGKGIDEKLQELGATRVHDLGLGDDGDCIEDDCDVWVQSVVQHLTQDPSSKATEGVEHVDIESIDSLPSEVEQHKTEEMERRISDKYHPLRLLAPETEIVRDDLFHLQNTDHPFYQPQTRKMRVTVNGPLSVGCGDYGLREMCISLEDHPDVTYEAGDLVVIYPRNSDCIVDAYLDVLDVDPQSIIEQDAGDSRKYPHPTGLTVRETLSHCVDLGAVPSPSFARELLLKKDIAYKRDIALTRKTALDLIYESGNLPTLEELLYNLPPMTPRHYSIASSALLHPREVFITYRPVKYVTSRGVLREGVATSFLSDLGVIQDDDKFNSVPAYIKKNPTFRLPQDIATPVLLIAGGCGVAPIRAFLEERIALQATQYGDGHLFLGFRNPRDEVYREVIDRAKEVGAVTTANVAYSSGCFTPSQACGLISDVIKEEQDMVYDAIERGAYIYVCGGQRSLGVAVENVLHSILQEKGNMNADEATNYLRQLGNDGRLCEDLAD